MRSLLFSPRARKRAVWLAAGVGVVAAVVVAGLFWPDSSRRTPPEAFSGEEAYVYHEPKSVKLTRDDRAHALAAAANFVTHAVARRNVDLAYDLTHPSLRGDITREEWRTQDIPVVPYPVVEARWKIDYSYPDALGLEVLLLPTAKSHLRPQVFNMELVPTGHGKVHKWLVSSWAPTGMTGAASAGPTVGAGGVPNIGASLQEGEARLDARWLLAPFAILLIIPVIVVGFYVRSWRRGRRAEAAYRGGA